MRKLLSASEIAALNLPGMPTTKVAITAKAKREGWYFEETTGLGGTKRIYEVPAKYFSTENSQSADDDTAREESALNNKVVGSIAAGSRDVDWDKMDLAMRALDEWEQERGVRVAAERRSAVISVLYDYLVRGEENELARVFKAIG